LQRSGSVMSWCWPDVDVHVIVKSQGETDDVPVAMAMGGGPFFYWSAGRCAVTDAPLEQLAVCRCARAVQARLICRPGAACRLHRPLVAIADPSAVATADPSARSTGMHDHPWITIPWITIPWITIPWITIPWITIPWITINPCNPLILSVPCNRAAVGRHWPFAQPPNYRSMPKTHR
jgi:hypothetical protein